MQGIKILARELKLAPETLVDWEMLRRVGEEYTFSIELMRRWIQQHRPLRRVKEELDKVIPLAETVYLSGEGFYRNGDVQQAKAMLRER